MFKLIILFLLLQLAVLARYIVFDAFEPISYASTYLTLAAAIFTYFLGKNFQKKEVAYTPQQQDGWSFLNKQRVFSNKKPLYKNDEKKGYIFRTYIKKWHYFIADFFGESFFLALSIQIEEDNYELIPTTKKLFTNQSYWDVLLNGEKIGKAKTVIDLKNTAKLKEVIEMDLYDKTYQTAAATVSSKIKLIYQDEQVGMIERSALISQVNVLKVKEDQPQLLIPLILHEYYFK